MKKRDARMDRRKKEGETEDAVMTPFGERLLQHVGTEIN